MAGKSGKAGAAEDVRRVSYKELRASLKRVVILGDPGGGKSTLCQKICYDMSRNAALVSQYGDRDTILPNEQKLPIRVVLRRFEQARIAQPQLDLLTYMCLDIVNYTTASSDDIRRCVVPLLESGQALLAFDGLDEILDTSKRRELAELVTAFCDRYPLCPVIVTSRLVGYDSARLPDGFEELVLERFDDDEVMQYLVKFMVVVGEKNKEDAINEADRFIQQTNVTASDLRRNPLLLGLMAYLFNTKGDVPGNRPEIYKDCATLMFDRWDGNRGILAAIPSDFERAELFSDLAARMYDSQELSGGVERSWLMKALREFFEKLYMDRSRSIAAAHALVEFIVGRAWIMSEVGDGIFAFTHQTFLEYFFARHMDACFDTVGGLLRKLRSRIIKREWDVVCHLALQLKTHTVNRKQDEALSWLNEEITKIKRERDRSAMMAFSARSLEYLGGSESSVSKLVTTIFNFSLQAAAGQSDDALAPVMDSYYSARARKDLIGSVIVKLLSDTLLAPDRGVALMLVQSMLNSRRGSRFVSRRGTWPGLPSIFIDAVKDSTKSGMIKLADSDALAAALSFQWHGEFKPEWINKYGLGAFAASYTSNESVGGLGWAALCVSSNFGERFRPAHIPKSVFMSFIGAVGMASPDSLIRHFERAEMALTVFPMDVWYTMTAEHRSDKATFIGLNVLWAIAARAEEIGIAVVGPQHSERYDKQIQLMARRREKMRHEAVALAGPSLSLSLAAISQLGATGPD